MSLRKALEILTRRDILVFFGGFSSLITITTQFDHDSPIFGSVSFVVRFTMSSMLLLFIHILSLKPFVFNLTASIIYIVVLEVLSVVFSYGNNEAGFQKDTVVYATITHTLLLLCVNMAAANAAYFLQIRHHDTFWKITQCLFYKEAHNLERILKEKTIHSVIPNHIANSLMSYEVQSLMNTEGGESHMLFPLDQLENVSILFADIVGFTSLCATMPAASIVAILNDIFSKFDYLSEVHSCEKISTLGDCYFCVSGWPQPDPNHASNIVDMGLDIVAELKRYKQENGFDINMRVGIHTGTVLSGVIGTKRFKYDVWSKDVTLAGQVERCSIPGNVVITEVTHRHISSNYVCERIKLQNFSSPITTYCVVEKKSHNTSASVNTWKHCTRISLERNVDAITSNSSSNTHPVQRLLFFIYYPMILAYLNLVVCHLDGFISEENVINIQVSFYVIIVSLATSINFMEVSYLATLLAGLITVMAGLFIAFLRQFSSCSRMSDGDLSTSNITSEDIEKYFQRHVLPETIILLFLLMFLLIQVNRMSETTVRRQFNGLMEAWLGKKETRIHTDQANRLLSNILPKHVNEELRKTGKFSKNHKCVGVLFASIENLHDFRMHDIPNQGEEEYAYIRLLNDIVSHFDHLLDRKEFSGIEKIKTMGCTYMAASGLSEVDERRPAVAHLVNLVNFALQLLNKIAWVNSKLNGQVQLKVGLNYGPVTSGVIGTTKLLYDIWGDTVNVASRMESTGVTGQIHLPASCVPDLRKHYKFERHGQILVKGKGVMDTMFVTGHRP